MIINRTLNGVLWGTAFTLIVNMSVLFLIGYLKGNLSNNPAVLMLIVGMFVSFYAVITGGVSGGIITELDLNFYKAALLNFVVSLFVGGFLIVLSGGGFEDEDQVYYYYYATGFIGALNGAFVSIINLSNGSVE